MVLEHRDLPDRLVLWVPRVNLDSPDNQGEMAQLEPRGKLDQLGKSEHQEYKGSLETLEQPVGRVELEWLEPMEQLGRQERLDLPGPLDQLDSLEASVPRDSPDRRVVPEHLVRTGSQVQQVPLGFRVQPVQLDQLESRVHLVSPDQLEAPDRWALLDQWGDWDQLEVLDSLDPRDLKGLLGLQGQLEWDSQAPLDQLGGLEQLVP